MWVRAKADANASAWSSVIFTGASPGANLAPQCEKVGGA
jgi:hypothetical protein